MALNLWGKVVEIVNKEMNTKANQILVELKAECPKKTGTTANSFHIMRGNEEMTVGTSGKGLIKTVYIGSTLLSAKYAAEGNGGRSRIITSTREYDRRRRKPGKLQLSDGRYISYVYGYTPSQNFVKVVADRHR